MAVPCTLGRDVTVVSFGEKWFIASFRIFLPDADADIFVNPKVCGCGDTVFVYVVVHAGNRRARWSVCGVRR